MYEILHSRHRGEGVSLGHGVVGRARGRTRAGGLLFLSVVAVPRGEALDRVVG